MAAREAPATSRTRREEEAQPTTSPPSARSYRWEQRKGDAMPRATVDPAASEDRPVVLEVELAPHQAVRELARLDHERADVAGDLVVAAGEHGLEDALAGLVGWAPDDGDQVGFDGERGRRRRRHREEDAGQVDAGGRAGCLTQVEVL